MEWKNGMEEKVRNKNDLFFGNKISLPSFQSKKRDKNANMEMNMNFSFDIQVAKDFSEVFFGDCINETGEPDLKKIDEFLDYVVEEPLSSPDDKFSMDIHEAGDDEFEWTCLYLEAFTLFVRSLPLEKRKDVLLRVAKSLCVGTRYLLDDVYSDPSLIFIENFREMFKDSVFTLDDVAFAVNEASQTKLVPVLPLPELKEDYPEPFTYSELVNLYNDGKLEQDDDIDLDDPMTEYNFTRPVSMFKMALDLYENHIDWLVEFDKLNEPSIECIRSIRILVWCEIMNLDLSDKDKNDFHRFVYFTLMNFDVILDNY